MKVVTQPIDYARDAHEIGVLLVAEGEAGQGAAAALDEKLAGLLRDLHESGEFRGEKGETALVHTRGLLPTKRLLLAGLGGREGLDLERVRVAAAAAARRARAARAATYAVHVPEPPPGASLSATSQAVVEGSLLALHEFLPYHTRDKEKRTEVKELRVGTEPARMGSEVGAGSWAGEAIASATCWARELALHPANVLTPTRLAEEALTLATHRDITVEVKDRAWMEEQGMGGVLAVSQGSHEPPTFLILEYRHAQAPEAPIVLVGKGVTFDSGGISLKDRENMGEMKTDMSGAAAVLGAFRAAAELGFRHRLVGLVPATENLPGGRAFRPGDIVRMMNGKTVEVITTDAEGRMILADALVYAARYKPAAVVDLATLTGAAVIALGHVVTAMMGTDARLLERLRHAGEASGDRVWELPLWPEYREQLKSDVADLKNVGGRPAGAITAGLFLAEFAEGYPWVHLDIAGPSVIDREISCLAKGPTGAGVRLLVELLRSWDAG